jgi:hypothetical protein
MRMGNKCINLKSTQHFSVQLAKLQRQSYIATAIRARSNRQKIASLKDAPSNHGSNSSQSTEADDQSNALMIGRQRSRGERETAKKRTKVVNPARLIYTLS